MPVIHIPIDDSTLIATSAVMSVITFGFCTSMGIKPGISLVIGAVVGIILYSLGIIPIGLLAVVGFSMIAVIFKKMFGSNTQQDNLTSQQVSQSISVVIDKPKDVAQVTSPELADSEEFKNFLIVDSIRQLTDLALSQGLIASQDKARKYWESFKSRILIFHLKRKSATLEEVKSAIEKELESVFQRSSLFVNEGMPEEFALATSIVEWYKYNNSLVQNIQSSHENKLTEKEVDASISNLARTLDFDLGWYANMVALSAEQGVATSQFRLGVLYFNGQQTVPQDYTEAAKWFRLAAEQGNTDAQSNLAWMYDEGRGVPQDYKEAMKWYRLRAEQGDAAAQFLLGEMYDKGQGVPQDYTEAAKWYRLAAEQGVADAQSILGEMYDEGRGVPQDGVLAQMWFDKSQQLTS